MSINVTANLVVIIHTDVLVQLLSGFLIQLVNLTACSENYA